MKFNEAVQAMLNGERVTRVNPTGRGYIMLNDSGEVVDNDGDLYRLYKKDFIEDWKIVDTPNAGTLLTRYGKTYRLIKETGDTYAVLDEEASVELVKGIAEKDLIWKLKYCNFDMVEKH